MTQNHQQIAIAALCGWTGIKQNPRTGVVFGTPPKNRKPQWDVVVPDYVNSLDAMAEAEKTLNDSQFAAYAKGMPPCATAKYRASKFLQAVKATVKSHTQASNL